VIPYIIVNMDEEVTRILDLMGPAFENIFCEVYV
jgi:hypothetical protein